MDSGNNSGSLQSSSGGEEEYDSVLNNPSHHHDFPPLSNHHHHHTFHPSPNLFHAFSHQSPPNPNLSLPLTLDHPRSDPNKLNTLPSSRSSTQSILGAQGSTSTTHQRSRSSPPPDHRHMAAPRNPKKRTRASRRAPTTVLTTDTTNFRAMVQEFTGIPAPPFSASPFSRSKLHLFGSVGSSALGPLFPHKLPHHQQSSLASSPLLSNTNNIATPGSVSSINYHLPQPQNMVSMQNQMLSIQSILQPPPLPIHPSLEDLGVSHGNVSATEGMREMMIQNHEHLMRSFDGNSQRASSCELNY